MVFQILLNYKHSTTAQDIVAGRHRVILTSPEMCLDHREFSKLMRSSEFMKNVLSIVVDEAHCISQ
jgi:superfamily II DNA helicase RecQ